MSTWYDIFGAEYNNATNVNYTDQSQINPTAVVGGSVGSVHVDNSQSNATLQHADAGSGYEAPYFGFGGDASNYNETHQYQNDPTLVFGGSIGSVDVHNSQSNYTEQHADAGSGGFFFPGFGGDASNFNLTTQVQANPTIVVGTDIGSVDVTNSQSNATFQDAHADHGSLWLPIAL